MAAFDLSAAERSRLAELSEFTPSARVLRRALALLWLAEGDEPTEVAERLGVSRPTLYNWVARFRARAGQPLAERLEDGPRSGRPPTALGVIDPLLAAVLDDDPRDWGYVHTTWTAPLLRDFLHEEHRLVVSRQSVSEALDRLGVLWKRPRHCLARRQATWGQAKGA
jgi:transposase